MNKGTNCVTTYLADCETQLSQAPRQGLLYGVPVSLKECFSYKVCPASVSGLNFPHPCQPALHPGLPWALRKYQVQRPCVGTVVCLALACERVVGKDPVLPKGPDSSATSLSVPIFPSRARTRPWA